MTAPASYTPLESLFLFQSLAAFGPDSASFSRISDLLKNNPLIRDSKSYDSRRLNPDALKELYQNLLKEEAKDQSGQNADSSVDSKKRKLSSPPLPSVREAVQHTKLLPHLVDRLYARYKDSATREIREEERKFQLLQQEIREIEQGLLDASLKRSPAAASRELGQAATPTVQGPAGTVSKVSDADRLATQGPEPKTERPPVSPGRPDDDSRLAAAAVQLGGPAGQALSTSQAADNATASPAVARQQGASQKFPDIASADSSVRSNAFSVPGPHGMVQTVSDAQAPPSAGSPFSRPQPPHLLSSQQGSPSYRVSSPSAAGQAATTPQPKPLPLAPQPQSPYIAPSASHVQPPSAIRPSSPAVIHPSPGVGRGAASPSLPSNDKPAHQQQLRPVTHPNTSHQPPFSPPASFHSAHGTVAANGIHSPVQLHTVPPPQVPHQRPLHPNNTYPYPGYQQNHPPLRPSQPQQHAQPYYHPGQGGVILPPFPASPYQPIESKKANNKQPYQQPPRPSTSVAFPATPDPSRPLVAAQVPPRISSSVPPQLPEAHKIQTPIQTSGLKGRPPPPSLSLDTSTSSTRWKNVDQQPASFGQTSPIRPRPESVSPISDRGVSPTDSLASLPKKTPKGKRGRPRRDASKTETTLDRKDARLVEQPERLARADKDQKSSSIRGRRTRGRSTSSSAVTRARTRSQSVLSHADELSMDNGAVSGRKIKREQPPTPASFAAEEDTDMAETAPDEGPRRHREDTSKGSDHLEPTRVAKRKRSHLSSPETADELRDRFVASHRPHHVLSTRNFTRTCSTIMNDITAHKHASMFAGPVKEKDAPGYKDLIYRPQDLKSIKAAIAAGGRATTAIASQADAEIAGSPAQGTSTPSKNANLWVPINPDVVPPRGIINSAQLEKELMRMFANAVMYNPDPDRGFGPAFQVDGQDENDEVPNMQEDEGRVVMDTREMYETVEKSVAEWRSAERAVEEMDSKPSVIKSRSGAGIHDRDDEADELAGDEATHEKGEDDLSSTLKKRRKL